MPQGVCAEPAAAQTTEVRLMGFAALHSVQPRYCSAKTHGWTLRATCQRQHHACEDEAAAQGGEPRRPFIEQHEPEAERDEGRKDADEAQARDAPFLEQREEAEERHHAAADREVGDGAPRGKVARDPESVACCCRSGE